MDNKKTIPLPALLMAAICWALSGCGGDPQDEGASGAEAAEQPSNRIDIPATVRNNLGITFAKVERRSVENTIRVPGAFELQPLARHEYRILLPGRVQFEVDQLQEMKPGDLLYRVLSPKWLELQSQVELAMAALEQTRAKFQAAEARIKALGEAEFKRADLEAQAAELRADVEKRKAELQAALNNTARMLTLHGGQGTAAPPPDDLLSPVEKDGTSIPYYQTIDWLEVRAIEPGVVESLAITDGAFVEETTLVLTTVDPSKIRFRALGLQSDLPNFQDNPQVRIVPPQAKGTDPNEGIEAELKIGLAADPNQRTVTLFATPDAIKPWVRPGMSAFLEIASESSGGPVLAIPRSAVVKDGIQHVFFMRDPNNANKAIRVEAELGVDDGRWVEIKSGIGPNAEVVVHGAYELKLATAQSGAAQKGGHFHADGSYHEEH